MQPRMNPRHGREFFERPTLEVARDLLGQHLVKLEDDGSRISGLICETEAYIGTEDDGCHARSGLTSRNRSMWGPAGFSYVFFTYGMHWMFNLVTEKVGFPAAVLLRAVIPRDGQEHMRKRRVGQPRKRWTDGPAKLCQAFGIDGQHDGLDVCHADAPIFVEKSPRIADSSVTVGPRVGLIRVAEPWKSIPWRFHVSGEFFADKGGI